jgi:hypothetical protein
MNRSDIQQMAILTEALRGRDTHQYGDPFNMKYPSHMEEIEVWIEDTSHTGYNIFGIGDDHKGLYIIDANIESIDLGAWRRRRYFRAGSPLDVLMEGEAWGVFVEDDEGNFFYNTNDTDILSKTIKWLNVEGIDGNSLDEIFFYPEIPGI